MDIDRKDAETRRASFLCVFVSLRSVIAAALFVGGAAFSDWPTYHGAFGLTGFSETSLPEQPVQLWRHNAAAAVDSTPVSVGKQIYFAARKGRVTALGMDGSVVWQKAFTRTNDAGQEMPIRFEAPLAVYNETVFAGSTRGILYALDAATGAERWRYDTEGSILGSAGVASNLVVVLDQSEGALHAIDIQTGKRLWKTEGVERCDGSPGIANGRIVFGSCLAALHVYDSAGTHLKDIEVGGDSQIAGGVAVDGGLAFAGTRSGSLLCADLEQGDIVWYSDESEEQAFSTPALAGGRVVYSSDDGFVYAVERQTGTLLWKFDTGGLPSSPVIAKDKVVVSADGILFLLSLSDGAKRWSKEISDQITSPALISGRAGGTPAIRTAGVPPAAHETGILLVGADDGTVSAFGDINDVNQR